MCKKVEACIVWLFGRTLRVSRRDKVLRRVGRKNEVLNTVKRGKLEYVVHIMRNSKYDLLQLIILGIIQGKKSVGSLGSQICFNGSIGAPDHCSELQCSFNRRLSLKNYTLKWIRLLLWAFYDALQATGLPLSLHTSLCWAATGQFF